ncbi:MAG: ATP-binding protein [Methylomonas sp.]|jgi:signal transduction histidine kinase
MFIEIEEKSAILVIDDNPDLREQLDEIFNGAGNAGAEAAGQNYLIHYGAGREEAKELIYNKLAEGAPYQLLFAEYRLRDGNGLQLISELWRMDPNLHVVLCSADTQLHWQQIVDTVGESDQLLFLQKPYSQLALRQIVHALLRKWQLNKQSQNIMKYMEKQIQERTRTIEEANRNLLQSEKLAAVGQLAAGIAHEINTPAQYVGDNISAIRDFYASLMHLLEFYRQHLRQLANEDLLAEMEKLEQNEDLEFILQDAPAAISQSQQGMTQITRIVHAMKGFSHVSASSAMRVNINLALENTLIVTQNSYKYHTDVSKQFAELPLVECYAGELNQVFLNIIVNAAHAIEDSRKGRGMITVTTLSTPKGVEIRIGDSGNGIPEEIRDRIFDPFFTTKEVGRGSGQGLNIAYRIITQQHGGKLRFETEIGVGTTFIISLFRDLPAIAAR